ncbi:Gfo/Idh/MocA family protein [Hirschia litorea]|uniref:Gfo/Idh/MocA family protein n=1 Tax=Hirschia litorea TaxID=1199156 RepID=A0ABW2INT8_9PROT
MGMIGGGPGAFIGEIHRLAANLDGDVQLVCGVFSRDWERTQTMAAQLGIPASRAYRSHEEMFEAEKRLPVEERMQFASIVTPNYQHFGAASDALKNGFHVVCDKPPTLSLAEVETLQQLAAQSGLLYALTFTYLGYPMVNEARQRVASGAIGKVRKVVVNYPQGWLSQPIEESGNKQASWRTDPEKSGPAGCLGDIGSHAHSLAEYISGQRVTHVCADLNTAVEHRRLDDDVSVLLKFDQGANGVLMASQISAGEENGITISVYGEKGGYRWSHVTPNTLIELDQNGPDKVLRAGSNNAYLHPSTLNMCRTPAGHPEGYLEAFANIYQRFSELVDLAHTQVDEGFGVADGVRSMRFIETVLASAKSDQKWTPLV